jgi:molybdopterin-binding protein
MSEQMKMGEAAVALGVRVETLRRWERDGKLRVSRSAGNQRLVPASEVARLLRERQGPRQRPRGSVRNRFDGVVTDIRMDGILALVELQAGPFRVVSVVTREAVEEMELAIGGAAVATVKATNVTLELPEVERER